MTGKAALIAVRVVPRASRPGVEAEPGGGYVVRVGAPPEGGRANAETIERLADFLGLPKSRLRIVRGAAARRKTIAVEGA